MSSSAFKHVPTTSLFENVDILYLLSHVNSDSLSMGRIFALQNALVPVTEFSYSKFQSK